MQLIPTPKKVAFTDMGNNKGQFIIEPLFPGYGLTVGSALRRVLFSSMPGGSITSVKIKGVEHEFSSMNYVKEDVVDILLNLKQINLRIDGDISEDEPLVLKINKTGLGKVTAADIEAPTQVTIMNKKQHIVTLTDKASVFEAELFVKKGMGYAPTETRNKEKLDIGHIAIDAIFTPINNVFIASENVRVGEMTNWDKLVLTIETNGAITPQEAFNDATAILVEQFSSLNPDSRAENLIPEKNTTEQISIDNSVAENQLELETDESNLDDKTEKLKKRGHTKKK